MTKKPKVWVSSTPAYKMRYKRLTVKLPHNPLTGIDEISGKPAKTCKHHWRYAYKKKDLLKNPELALENTTELNWPNHIQANALRIFTEISPEKLQQFFDLMDKTTQVNFILRCDLFTRD